MIGSPLKMGDLVAETSRRRSRVANEVPERRRILAGAINDVLEA
ncbi:MAG: hypothetical protein ACREX3_04710 [Gammaproteobacteria bacterium]